MLTLPGVAKAEGLASQSLEELLRESDLHLHRYPSEPTTQELQENGRAFPPGYLHESWRDFLYWDSELEQS